MPNVLHAIDTGGPGGAESVFAHLACDLAARGYAPTATVPYVGWLHERLTASRLPTQVIASKGGFSASYLRALGRIVRARGIDLIHSHLLGSNVYCSLAGALAGVPVVCVFHGLPDISGRNRLLWLKRRLLLLDHCAIVSVSENLAEALARWGVPERRITVIVNGIDTSQFQPGASPDVRRELGAGPDDILVGSVGNVRPAKNYSLLVEAAALALARQPNLRFVVAGQGKPEALQPLRDQAAARGISERLTFLGFYPSSPALLRAFDIFLSSSITEGLPLSFLEAMACGVPVVATSNGGSDEVLARGSYGKVVPQTASDLAEGILQLAAAPNERSRLAEAGRARTREVYEWSTTIDAYVGVYERLLAGHR